MDGFNFFVLEIFPVAVLLVGLIGNISGLIVLSDSRLNKIQTRNIYIFLFTFDTLYLLQLIIIYMQFGYDSNYNLTIKSSLFCKIFNYLNYSMATISPYMIIFLSFERWVTVSHPTKRNLVLNSRNQTYYLIGICVYLGSFYFVYPFYYDVVSISTDNTTILLSCNFIDTNSQTILSFLYLVNSTLLPFLLMIIFSLFLISFIFKSRKRVESNYTSKENRKFQKDIKFSITSIGLNLIFILMNSNCFYK